MSPEKLPQTSQQTLGNLETEMGNLSALNNNNQKNENPMDQMRDGDISGKSEEKSNTEQYNAESLDKVNDNLQATAALNAVQNPTERRQAQSIRVNLISKQSARQRQVDLDDIIGTQTTNSVNLPPLQNNSTKNLKFSR